MDWCPLLLSSHTAQTQYIQIRTNPAQQNYQQSTTFNTELSKSESFQLKSSENKSLIMEIFLPFVCDFLHKLSTLIILVAITTDPR